MNSNIEIVEVEVTQAEAEHIMRLFPNMALDEFMQRAMRKILADARLREFAAQKQAEVAAEERRLNAELGA